MMPELAVAATASVAGVLFLVLRRKHASPTTRPTSSRGRLRRIGFGVVGAGMLLFLFGVTPSVAHATQPNPEHKVTLCHATDSYSNPYVRITVDVASVLHHGHDGHNGPVFFAAIPKHTKWGDIIPPFDFGPGESYAGKNWTSAGIAVFDNGCAVATISVSTTTTPGTTPTSGGGETTTTLSTSPSTTPRGGGETTTTIATAGNTTPSTGSSGPTTTISSAAVASSTPTRAATATAPGAPTMISGAAVTPHGESASAAPGSNTGLPFTGGETAGVVVAAVVLITSGLGLALKKPLRR